ncbi:hypothetical protein [Nostoc sp. C052]|uniref:hypothetical protein n=1 Tax=Nostoc sp. C052 TaxID=2576902 RepID=UPI0015C362EA|nr:hypothetical protein [Nostoc sp. C052]
MPLSGVVEFVGREAELQNLHEMLQENNQVVIAAIASPQIQNKLVLCKAYRNKTEKSDRLN